MIGQLPCSYQAMQTRSCDVIAYFTIIFYSIKEIKMDALRLYNLMQTLERDSSNLKVFM